MSRRHATMFGFACALGERQKKKKRTFKQELLVQFFFTGSTYRSHFDSGCKYTSTKRLYTISTETKLSPTARPSRVDKFFVTSIHCITKQRYTARSILSRTRCIISLVLQYTCTNRGDHERRSCLYNLFEQCVTVIYTSKALQPPMPIRTGATQKLRAFNFSRRNTLQ